MASPEETVAVYEHDDGMVVFTVGSSMIAGEVPIVSNLALIVFDAETVAEVRCTGVYVAVHFFHEVAQK